MTIQYPQMEGQILQYSGLLITVSLFCLVVVARLDPHERYRSKLLLGINLYGYDYSKSRHRQDVVGNLFSEIVKHNSVTCEWSKVDGEVNLRNY